MYVGKTQRNPTKRWREHISGVKSSAKKSWTSKGSFFKPIGAVWSSNCIKAEQTIKKMKPAKKKAFGVFGAKKYKKRW